MGGSLWVNKNLNGIVPPNECIIAVDVLPKCSSTYILPNSDEYCCSYGHCEPTWLLIPRTYVPPKICLGKKKITVLFAKFNAAKFSLRLYLHLITHLSYMPGLEFIDTKFILTVQSTRQPLTLIVLDAVETIFQSVRTVMQQIIWKMSFLVFLYMAIIRICSFLCEIDTIYHSHPSISVLKYV